MPAFTVRLLHPGNSLFLLPVLIGVCQYGQNTRVSEVSSHYSHYQKFTFVLPMKLLVDDITEQREPVSAQHLSDVTQM